MLYMYTLMEHVISHRDGPWIYLFHCLWHKCSKHKLSKLIFFIFIQIPLLCTSSSRAMTDNSSLSTAGETSFSQLIHWHPSVHLEFFLLHPQTLFLHPVTHLYPLNSKFTLSHTNCMFSSVSHTTQSFMFSIVQPFSVMGLNPWYFCVPVPTCLEPSMFSSSGNRVHQWWNHACVKYGSICDILAYIINPMYVLYCWICISKL